MNPPSNQHDCAIWLLERLDGLTNVDGHWEGILPDIYDFTATIREIPPNLLKASNSIRRRIEFRPGSVGVFQNLPEFLKGINLRKTPAVFTIRDISYTHGKTTPIPREIQNYLDAVRLWTNLNSFSDYAKDKGTELLFIQSFDSQVWIIPEYNADDLIELPGINDIITQYFEDKHHHDQKRNIIRSSLLEIFKDKRRGDLSFLLRNYQDFIERIKSSYALYTNDFSFERLKSEVNKQNQEDTLRLNKTLSEIQNQLLALPAALLAAGAGIKSGELIINLTILSGIGIYSWFMHQLIVNQENSIDAINAEVELRENKIKNQPETISKDVLPLFQSLSTRVKKQRCVLRQIRIAVWIVFIISLVLVILANFSVSKTVSPYIWAWLNLKDF